MTSDAKVGLILGLVFIFIIAFIINGLPSLRRQNGNELTTINVTRPNSQSPGIAKHARRTTREIVSPPTTNERMSRDGLSTYSWM